MVGDNTNELALVGDNTKVGESTKERSPLLPIRHQPDFFVCDIFDAAVKADAAAMEHPIFSLSKKPDMKIRRYENGEKWAEVRPSVKGLATVFDRDILIYCISQLIAAEHVHRDQLARINRLKQIAERQGRRDRVGELDQLLINANTNFDSTLQRAKGKLTDAEYTNTVAMLEQGRRREVQSLMGGGGGAEPADATRERASTPSRTATPTRPPH